MKDKVIIVTGGAAGMGEAAVILAAEKGAKVVIADINENAAISLGKRLNSKGMETSAVKCDISKAEEVEAMVNFTVETYGRLDGAFNNAGIMSPMTGIAELDEKEYDRVMNIDMKGSWLCMKYELRQMKKQGFGAIVNNSSIGGLIGGIGRAAYHAAKHAVLGLTKCAAIEYAPLGIRVNAVCPGTIETPMVDMMVKTGDLSEQACIEWAPIKRLGKASEVADAVIWLLSSESSYVVGQAISVDGGLRTF